MPTDEREEEIPADIGDYIWLDGTRRNLKRHPTDFSVDEGRANVEGQIPGRLQADVRQLAIGVSRVIAIQEQTDELIGEVRKDKKTVAHRIYELEDTGEEIVITDRIFLTLTLSAENSDKINAIADKYKLKLEGQTENVYTLKVTWDSGHNPLKIANMIAGREGVVSCVPEILFPIQFGSAPVPDQPALSKNQWHLAADLVEDQPLDRCASMNVERAWVIAGGKGKAEIVIAVIDDGFDLINPKGDADRVHPAFSRSNIDEAHMRNFGDDGNSAKNVYPTGNDFHGTSVASIIFADGDAMSGVAPGCKFLPIRIGSFARIKPDTLIEILEEVSPLADVVNCSFSMSPQSHSLINRPPDFLPRISRLIAKGGRRGGGLVIVFSAGNDAAPISRCKLENQTGITVVRRDGFGNKPFTIPKGLAVHCGFAEIPGVIVVGAMTSLKRKAGYSNWGKEITIVTPSNNGHDLIKLKEGEEQVRRLLPGLGIVAALNRTFDGAKRGPSPPLADLDIAETPMVQEALYTKEFGFTSAAAAMVSGVIGLMLSVNPKLTRQEIIDILKETAEDKMNSARLVDLENDLNLRGVDGAFVNKRSKFFGSGKVDAAAAVQAAKDKLG
ncbi:MAG: S8 family serine peptidase [Acidobacteriota bacterium]